MQDMTVALTVGVAAFSHWKMSQQSVFKRAHIDCEKPNVDSRASIVSEQMDATLVCVIARQSFCCVRI